MVYMEYMYMCVWVAWRFVGVCVNTHTHTCLVRITAALSASDYVHKCAKIARAKHLCSPGAAYALYGTPCLTHSAWTAYIHTLPAARPLCGSSAIHTYILSRGLYNFPLYSVSCGWLCVVWWRRSQHQCIVVGMCIPASYSTRLAIEFKLTMYAIRWLLWNTILPNIWFPCIHALHCYVGIKKHSHIISFAMSWKRIFGRAHLRVRC